MRHRETPESGAAARGDRALRRPGSRQIIGNFPWRLVAKPATSGC
ncbi:uncharacterized protein BCN122_II2954 [Burkholderia cenocepacia]|nr:uncharacterized protein BCN122_II2954 [Burkholderia cenocepacia]